MFLTLGTGVGSGVFIDGRLVPNVEFGTMEIRGKPAEWRSASAARTRRGLGWKAWALDLDEHLDRIDKLVWPTLMILGGGVSKNGDKFIPRLTVRCPIVAADLRNDAGHHRRGHRRRRGIRAPAAGHLARRRPCRRLGRPAALPIPIRPS